MAIDLVTITGTLDMPNGNVPSGGKVRFRLSGPDWSTPSIFLTKYSEVAVDAGDGTFSVDLQSTDGLTVGHVYTAIALYTDTATGYARELALGTFAVPAGGPYTLASLLAVPVVAPEPASVLAAAQAQAVISTTKAGEASTSADLSEAWAAGTEPGGPGTKSALEWAGDAAASAALVDLGALDTAVTAAQTAQTGAETAETNAETAETGAQTAQAAAELHETGAETALAATIVAAASIGVYADTTLAAALVTGLAAASEGETFHATGDDVDYIGVYTDLSGVATERARYPKSSAVQAIDDFVQARLVTRSALSETAMLLGEDDTGRAAIVIYPSGEVEMPATLFTQIPTISLDALSGYAVKLGEDDAGRVPFGIGFDGNPIFKGLSVDMSAVALASAEVFPEPVIDCWGDSLTHGNTAGVTTPYPTALAALLPTRTVRNKGRSGRTSLQNATAFGAAPSLLTVTSNTIPTSGAVTVTETLNGNFSSKSDFGTINTLGSLFGIPGTLAVGFNSGDPELPGTTTFTRTTAGAATLIPAYTPFIPDTDDWESNTVVIWHGRNDAISFAAGNTSYDNDFILANIEAMIEFLEPLRKRFVVLTVTDSSVEYSGAASPNGASYDRIIALNKEIMRRWPRNAIDVRQVLVNSYDSGIPADVTAFSRSQVPPSLQQDGLHLNDAGYAIVAQAVSDFITTKGW